MHPYRRRLDHEAIADVDVGAPLGPTRPHTAAPRRDVELGAQPRRVVETHGELPEQPRAHVIDMTRCRVGIGGVLQRASQRVESKCRVGTDIAEADVTANLDDATAPGPGGEAGVDQSMIVRRHDRNLA